MTFLIFNLISHYTNLSIITYLIYIWSTSLAFFSPKFDILVYNWCCIGCGVCGVLRYIVLISSFFFYCVFIYLFTNNFLGLSLIKKHWRRTRATLKNNNYNCNCNNWYSFHEISTYFLLLSNPLIIDSIFTTLLTSNNTFFYL